MSKRSARSAANIESHGVATYSTVTPRRSASAFITSMSKPVKSSPFRIEKGA